MMKNPFKTDLPEFFEWVDPERERKDNKNAIITGWGLGLGVAFWVLFGVLGSGIAGFLLFFVCWFGSYMLTED